MAKPEVLEDSCDVCGTELIQHKDRVFCTECNVDKRWEMHIPKEIFCPICGTSMAPLRTIDTKGSLKLEKFRSFMCDRCYNVQYFLNEEITD